MPENALKMLRSLLDRAKRDPGHPPAIDYGEGREVHDRRLGIAAGSTASLSLRMTLPEILDSEGHVTVTPSAAPANELRTIGNAVLENSRVIQAGARLIEIADGQSIAAAVPVFREEVTRFSVIGPAPFAPLVLSPTAENVVTVTDAPALLEEGTVTSSPLPVSRAEIDRAGSTQRAVRFVITHTTQRKYGSDQIMAEVLKAIVLGLGRAVDAELLGALGAQALATFTPASAAAAGLRQDELRAVVGTDGTGAAADRGALFVDGIPAELTADAAGTMIAAWNRFAVAVEPEIRVVVERNSRLEMIITVFTDMQAMVPDPAFAWAAV